MTDQVRIVVIDDIEGIRRGMTSLLETERPGWKVVAEAENGERAIEMVRLHKPDIVLMNLSMPGRRSMGSSKGPSRCGRKSSLQT